MRVRNVVLGAALIVLTGCTKEHPFEISMPEEVPGVSGMVDAMAASPDNVSEPEILPQESFVAWDEAIDGDFGQRSNTENHKVFGEFNNTGSDYGETIRLRLGLNLIRGSTFVSTYPSHEPWWAIHDREEFVVQVPTGAVLRMSDVSYQHHSARVSGNIPYVKATWHVVEARPLPFNPGNGRAHFFPSTPFVQAEYSTEWIEILRDGVLTELDGRIGFFSFANGDVNPRAPAGSLPAGRYKFHYGFAWQWGSDPSISARHEWSYQIGFIVTPAP